VRIPQVPLWLGWANLPNYYPNNWQRQVHQYALSTFLYYLTDQVGVTDSALVSIFYSGTSMNPQQYLFNQLGAAAFRNHFIDCAAHMTNDFDFILPSQANNALAEWNSVADPSDDNQFIQTYTNAGSGGWFRPADPLTTTAWSFNTYRLLNTQTETYTFELNGDVGGTFGYNAYFQGKILVRNSVTGARFYDLAMSNDYQGTLSLNLTPNDTEVYFIVASMPEVFADNNSTFQLFPYEMRIRTGIITGFSGDDLVDPDYQVGRWNLLGQPIQEEDGGLQVIRFSDGSTKKVFLPK
jgi:hypothetical protein